MGYAFLEVGPGDFKNAAEGAVCEDIGGGDDGVQNDIEGEDQSDHLWGKVKVGFINGEHDEDGATHDGCGCVAGEDKDETKG